MPYHVKSPGKLNTGDVYYEGGDSWTQVYANRKQFSSSSDATAIKSDIPIISTSFSSIECKTKEPSEISYSLMAASSGEQENSSDISDKFIPSNFLSLENSANTHPSDP